MPANMKKAGKKYMYGGMKKKKMSKGGSLKPVPKDNKGLGKLPEDVRNKMGYMMYGGSKVKKMKPYMYGGKKVPGMFEEDDRMMYGGMKKKRMQYGEEVEKTPEDKKRHEMVHGTDEAAEAQSGSNQAKNWNKKLTRLTDKRAKRKEKGKSTTRVQKRINKAMKKAGN
jgi:hypothetical protein